MTYAILAARKGHSVTIAEKNSRLGKKLAATGNGKCNVGNAHVDESCFNSSAVLSHVLSAVPVGNYLQFLQSVGVFTYDDGTGRLYPLSDSASNVVDCFRSALSSLSVRVLTDCPVSALRKQNGGGFLATLGGKNEFFHKVVYAVGSPSQAENPHAFSLIPTSLFTPLCPSLAPLKVDGMDRVLSGLRCKCHATLTCNGTPLATRSGEVQFKEYGLSGICIFDLSALVARSFVRGEQPRFTVILDLVPHLSAENLANILAERQMEGQHDATLFYGILHNKVAEAVLRKAAPHLAEMQAQNANSAPRNAQSPVQNAQFVDQKTVSTAQNAQFLDYQPQIAVNNTPNGEQQAESIAQNSQFAARKAKVLAQIAKSFPFKVVKTLDWSMSQATAGGIAEQFVNLDDLTLTAPAQPVSDIRSNSAVGLSVVNSADIASGKTTPNAAHSFLETPNSFGRNAQLVNTAGTAGLPDVNSADVSSVSGITVLGEALNVDGFCGGNNLYFAAASAIYAAKSL